MTVGFGTVMPIEFSIEAIIWRYCSDRICEG